ncbi:DUF4199 domain-containing protein [Larkinella insperata]|uniref:DUF4199 domain-containing protein n=1 Tax=Larkinella insperata TaxID=332158 RepID=A0ABW3Q5D0_9BACT|nr:DUF4199 domain-containing protein [Larkinella insperata]
MKKIVLICGLISGFLLTAMMVVSTAMCYLNDDFKGNMVLGYASMVLAFALIFVGIKNYRDKHNNGVVSFGKAFRIGLSITLIASSMYVIVWLIDYYLFIPDFMDKYTAHVLREAQNDGISPADLSTKTQELQQYKEMYKNPLFVVLFTYLEVLPIGLLISLICALLLKKGNRSQVQPA